MGERDFFGTLEQAWKAAKTYKKIAEPIKKGKDIKDVWDASDELQKACKKWAEDPSAQNRKGVDDAYKKQYKELVEGLPLPYPAIPKKIRDDTVENLSKDRFTDEMRKALDDLEWRKGRDDTYLDDKQRKECSKYPQEKFKRAKWWRRLQDPLALDLDGDGIETVGADAGILFDHDADGTRVATGWVKGDDGLLAIDLDGNGRIDSGRELFGDHSLLADGSVATSGFAALAQYDSNHDGKVDASDARWGDLRVWRDIDASGTSRADELFTLAELGVAALDISCHDYSITFGNGNSASAAGSFLTSQGNSQLLVQLNLDEDRSNVRYPVGDLDIPDDISSLPRLASMGFVRDLHSAAVESGALKVALQTLANSGSPSELSVNLDRLLDSWAATASHVPSHTVVSYEFEGIQKLDASAAVTDQYASLTRKIWILEVFTGESFARPGASGLTPVSGVQIGLINSAFDDLKNSFYDHLVLNTILVPYISRIQYSEIDGDAFMHFNLVEEYFNARYAQDPGAAVVELMDLCRLQQKQFAAVGWNAFGFAAQALKGKHVSDSAAAQLNARGVFLGNDGPDSISLAGQQSSITFDGDDTINSDSAAQTIYSGAGNDTIQDAGGDDLIDAGDGDDVIYDMGGRNELRGGAGNDMVKFFGASSNVVYGEAGNDTLTVDNEGYGNYDGHANRLEGGTGNDTIRTGATADTVVFNRGDGQDSWRDNGVVGYSGGVRYDPGMDTLQFGAGIAKSDLSLSRQGSHLVVDVRDP
ncbi:calcium-binding protein, partial [Pelomonas sp. BJYL3]|uniref:calcium-binding protein n=1 Tax=Pelomonas sp. BJYL3 TaxID=2976697 RepID=UPI0022B4D783